MGLSREEERALQEIEEQLAFDDPELDALLTRARPARPAPEQRFTARMAAWWVIAVLAYVAFLIGLVMTVTTPEDVCRGPGPCDQPVAPKLVTGQIM